jgi:hypothetical protein
VIDVVGYALSSRFLCKLDWNISLFDNAQVLLK